MKPIHFVQMQVLRKLLFSKGLKFSELKSDLDIENNLFVFHLKELQRQNLVEHLDDIYCLTDAGKEYANRMDTDITQMQIQAKVAALSIAYKEVESGIEFLIYTRLKHPFYGSQGFPSGKVKWGELISNASKREFKEETNLDGEPELFKIKHYVVHKLPFKEIVEDKIFFFFRIVNPTGELKANEEGKFEWVNERELENYIVKPFESVEETIGHAREAVEFSGQIDFNEKHEYTENF